MVDEEPLKPERETRAVHPEENATMCNEISPGLILLPPPMLLTALPV